MRDLRLDAVIAHRYQCPRCGRTFRVYPAGISHDQTSARLKGLAVMFYALGHELRRGGDGAAGRWAAR